MGITFVGGTAQQQRWVNEAVALCGYPLSQLPDFTVAWADATPCGAQHTYMCTSDAGGIIVTIESWADVDSSGQPPIPSMFTGDQLHEFYMEGFVHELGHVASFAYLTSDALLAQAAALFTHIPDGRVGTLADWHPPISAWNERIQEAVAEWFKMGYYNGALIYKNRTNWFISEANFAALMEMLSPPPSGGETLSGTVIVPGPAFTIVAADPSSVKGAAAWYEISVHDLLVDAFGLPLPSWATLGIHVVDAQSGVAYYFASPMTAAEDVAYAVEWGFWPWWSGSFNIMGGPNPGAELATVDVSTSTLPYLGGVIGVEIQLGQDDEVDVASAEFLISGTVAAPPPPPTAPYPIYLPGTITAGAVSSGTLRGRGPRSLPQTARVH